MRGSIWLIGVLSVAAVGARAQSFGGGMYGMGGMSGGDPCAAQQSMSGGALGMLTGLLAQQQRERACAAKRQAQWAEYSARQRAAKDQADAAAAKQKADADAAAQARDQAASAKAASASREAKRRQVASVQARREQEAARAAAKQEDAARRQAEREALVTTRARYEAILRAERSPDNFCRARKLARGVIDGWNDLDSFKDAGVKVIDIEHFTTVYFHPEDQSFACHGVFVTNRGWKVVGTTSVRRNVAGDPMFVWTRDADQDLSVYATPPAPDASSPEFASQMKVGAPPASLTRAVSAQGEP